MYSAKRNIQQLTSLMKSANIDTVVVCPGSRNAPLVHNFNAAGMTCYEVTDERSAGFFAIGLIEAKGGNAPVAVCCTSGSAVLNLAPAVAESYYHSLPLLVITADRPQRWIGQMDGQTLPQPGAFGQMVSKSVQLPEPAWDDSDPICREETWYCNRLINEALVSMKRSSRPVHINVPITEPLFDFSMESLPEERIISCARSKDEFVLTHDMENIWRRSKRPMIIVGQMLPEEAEELDYALSKLHRRCVILAEELSNILVWDCTVSDDSDDDEEGAPNIFRLLMAEDGDEGPSDATESLVDDFAPVGEEADRRMVPFVCRDFDYIIRTDYDDSLCPDLVITIGGHIVSKRLKRMLRDNPPHWHWHVSADGEVADLFQHVTHVVESSPKAVLQALVSAKRHGDDSFVKLWYGREHNAIQRMQGEYGKMSDRALTDVGVLQTVLHSVDESWHLQVANSSMVRNLQLLPSTGCTVYCNRGVNGIEGSVSTAAGYAVGCKSPTLLLIGDLSFFYDQNGLWNAYMQGHPLPGGDTKACLRVLLINNGGGKIFETLPGLSDSPYRDRYVAASHNTTAEGIALENGCAYRMADSVQSLADSVDWLLDDTQDDAVRILEVKILTK